MNGGPLDAATDSLIQYLSNHETDIAHGINDFADLQPIFVAMFQRHPRGNPKVLPIVKAVEKAIH